jgi:hypothetical protein
MMNQPMAAETTSSRSQVPFMLLSAGIFAYFGFATSWAHQYTSPSSPQPNALLPMVVLLKWTLRGAAIAFGASALLSFITPFIGAVIFSLVGIIAAVLFVVVGIWEMSNPNGYFSGVPAILLFIFAVWNGYGSWMGLRETLNSRRSAGYRGELGARSMPPI